MELSITDISTKIEKLISWLDSEFLEREDVVRGAVLAIMSGEHVLILGPPGTAKSLLARTVCSGIENGRFFYYLLTKFTTPEEIFGPLSLKALEEDRFERKIEGYLPTAHIVFLDEIFKASSAILNTLLTIINERKFHMGEKIIDVPLLSIFGASNELPEENESLEALYDRFLLRFEVDYVSNEDSFAKIAIGEVEEKGLPKVLHLTIEEIKFVQSKISSVKIPRQILREILVIRNKLFERNLKASDRRWKKIIKILRVSALLNNRGKVDYSDLFLLKHMLWDKPEDKKVVNQVLIDTLTRGVREASDIEEKTKLIAEHLSKETKIKEKLITVSNQEKWIYFVSIKGEQKNKLKELFYSSLNELLDDLKESLNIINERRRFILNQLDRNIFVSDKSIKDMLNERIDNEIKKLKDLEQPIKVLISLLDNGSLPHEEIVQTPVIGEFWKRKN